jgi:hypothetical protein
MAKAGIHYEGEAEGEDEDEVSFGAEEEDEDEDEEDGQPRIGTKMRDTQVMRHLECLR